MLLKGLLSAVALAAGITISAGFVLDPAIGANGADTDADTLSMAPFSLGNRATASSGLQVRGPGGPQEADIGLAPPRLFQVSPRVSARCSAAAWKS